MARRERWFVLIVLTVLAINITPLALLCEPLFRYRLQSVPLAIIGAGLGWESIRSFASFTERIES